MKKLFIFALMVLVGISLVSLSFADEARIIKHRTECVTTASGGQLVVAGGTVLYKVNGYASSANAVFSITDASSVGVATPSSTAVKVEGGEATQYDSITPMDFGSEGLVFDSGIVIYATGCSVVVEYL